MAGKKAPAQRKKRPASKGPRRRAGGNHGNGRKFTQGQNSHEGTVFRRGPDLIPRGNATLMLKVVANDKRETIYKNLCKLVEKPLGAFYFNRELADRTEGRPVKKVEKSVRRTSVFVFTTKDGAEVPALPAQPRQVGSGATAAAASAEDRIILGLDPERA